jgi:hypothetical protein
MSLESRLAIEEFETLAKGIILRGYYRPGGESGSSLRKLMIVSRPALYPLAADPDRVDAGALGYVLMRLPDGIWSVRQITVAREIEKEVADDFDPVETRARRRPTYRTGEAAYVTAFRGGMSDLVDFVSALTCFQIESDKIRARYAAYRQKLAEEPGLLSVWRTIDSITAGQTGLEEDGRKRILHELSVELRCEYAALKTLDHDLDGRLLEVVGHIAGSAPRDLKVVFSDRFGLVGAYPARARAWTDTVKAALDHLGLSDRPLFLVSSNRHSLANCLSPFVREAARSHGMTEPLDYGEMRGILSDTATAESRPPRDAEGGLHQVEVPSDMPGCSLVDIGRLDPSLVDPRLLWNGGGEGVILNMDYAFGEEGFFLLNELLETLGTRVRGIYIIGKAGTLAGVRGDIMLPTFFVKQGSGDVYDIGNTLVAGDFEGLGDFRVLTGGPMLTVAGTFLQNSDVLGYFRDNWNALGVEMEGIPYAKALKHARLRGRLSSGMEAGVAYYASDAPLSGDLLSVPLGRKGVGPVYATTIAVLRSILRACRASPGPVPPAS